MQFIIQQSGGIIWAESNSEFINNRVSVRFHQYLKGNISRIEDCAFRCDDNFLDLTTYNGEGNDVFVDLWN